MYVQCCPGGFPMPFVRNKIKVIGLCATVSDPTAASQIIMWDDENVTDGNFGLVRELSEISSIKTPLINIKGLANADANLEVLFPETITFRRGSSIAFTNLVPASTMLYVL